MIEEKNLWVLIVRPAQGVGKSKYFICTNEFTAIRYSKDFNDREAYCTDIEEEKAKKIDGKWYIPEDMAVINYPTEEDIIEQRNTEKLQKNKVEKQKIFEKAISLGLTENELSLLITS